MFIIDIMMAISNWLWGWPLLILTSAVAVYLSVRFKFFQFTRFGHAMKNTFGKIFDKGDGLSGRLVHFPVARDHGFSHGGQILSMLRLE